MEEQEPKTVFSFMAEKLKNFEAKFAGELELVRMAHPELEFTVEKIVAGLITAKPLWNLFEERDWASIYAILEVDESLAGELELYNSLEDERKELLHRYIFFFYSCVEELNQ